MVVLRVATAVLALLLASHAPAVIVADRSPFAQGHWWDPARAGSGFDIFNASGQVGVVWFTFDEVGRPVWYTAGGTLASMGEQAWPLMKHRWVDGRKQAPAQIGSLRLTLRHAESAEVAFDIGGKQGTWTIQPFVVSGVINETDHSGHWFDPGNSGWGFSLVEQGDVLGGALFTYDSAGEPTWVSGYDRGATSIEYQSFRGACPYCTYAPPTAANAGRLTFQLASETELTVRAQLSVAMAAGLGIDGARVTQLGRPASTRPADRQLASFDSAAALKAYLDVGMQNIPSDVPQVGFSASPPPSNAFSATNLQESGVDEADVVKSDGRFIYTFAHDAGGTRQPSVRIARVDNEGAALTLLGDTSLSSKLVGTAGLFLRDDQLVAVTGGVPMSYLSSTWTAPYAWTRGVTNIEVFARAESGALFPTWRAEIEGSIVASRRIGSRLYVVSRYVPWLPGFNYGTPVLQLIAQNQQLLANTPLSALLPKVRIDGGEPAELVGPESIHVPPQGARKTMADMILVTAIDLDTPRIAQTLAIVGTVETVYASTTSLVVATSRYSPVFPWGALLPPEPPLYLTDLHQIDTADTMAIVGSAAVEGHLGSIPDKASFRLSEHGGKLRVITSSTQMWPAGQQNRLTILEPSKVTPGLLRTVSYLPNKNRPQTIGKPYELLYGTRFLGDRLYAVTFRLIDPLYVIDLADAADPRIAGALELPGFSEYLHPLPNGLLLGFGKDARPASSMGDGQFAWYQGLQLSLYDVTDAGKPREIQRVLMGKRGSESALMRDHHAFSALMQSGPAGTFAFPARIADGEYPEYGSGDSAVYPWRYSGLMRVELRGTGATDAQLVPLPTLVTHQAPVAPGYFNDPALSTGRSVQFPKGTIYVGHGRFWRQDASGSAAGPY